ncbi:hypothetical protein AB0K09_24280 [Streptomyces sp. NPDC049577]|uniref:hypothetical protein n=1 Tax=Streptomyces sp. NPDC049577 TaxID=3155153 RepID=UPI003426AB62
MRTLLRARLDTPAANAAIRDGSMMKGIEELMERLRPEAAYFTTMDGGRSCFFVFDMQDASEMPACAEKLFLGMDAEVEMHPVMNIDDLRRGLEALSGD